MVDVLLKKELINRVLYKPLVGKDIRIIESKNPFLVGITGVILYETALTFHIETEKGIKKVLKSIIVFETDVDGKALKISGDLFKVTTSSRIKKIK